MNLRDSIETKLEQLKNLYKKKLVSEQEYEQQRKVILNQFKLAETQSDGAGTTVASSETSSYERYQPPSG